jgi:hypothetical protein
MNTFKTTVYLTAADYNRLKALAEREGRSTAELVREAVSEYARRHAGETRPRSIGALRTSDPALSQKTDELLAGFGA